MSQLALACEAATTPPYVSYLEAGRSRPSRQMVLRLSEALDVPLRERNRLLEAAGLTAECRAVVPGAPDVAPYEGAVERVLTLHEQYPGLAVDRHWNVTLANCGSQRLFGPALVGANLVHRYFGDPSAVESIVNWPDVARAGASACVTRSKPHRSTTRLRALLAMAETAIGDMNPPLPADDALVVCPHFRVNGDVIRTVGMVLRFDTAIELTLDELRVELTYPADETAHGRPLDATARVERVDPDLERLGPVRAEAEPCDAAGLIGHLELVVQLPAKPSCVASAVQTSAGMPRQSCGNGSRA